MLPLLLHWESVGLDEASVSTQTAAASPAALLPPLAEERLSLRLGGEDVHRVFSSFFVLGSELFGHGSEVKLLYTEFERSGWCCSMFVSCCEAPAGCGLMVRGSGLTILQMGYVSLALSLDPSSISSELKITLKCVFPNGVMVNTFGTGLSFLLT